MLTRRIAATVCTLCLVIPAAAGATVATPLDIIKAKGPAGATAATPQGTVKAKGPAGATVATSQGTIEAKGPAGATVATSQKTVAAKGPAGATLATHPPPHVTGAAYAAGASNRGDTNGWRAAAIAEAALLAALALGSVLLLTRSARDPRVAT